MEQATFAAGCFWGVEDVFMQLPGVVATQVGYTGGTTVQPTYEQVCTGTTGHKEAVRITYDPTALSYADLLDVFWNIHTPTTRNQQGSDTGEQYHSVIFYHNEEQRSAAVASKKMLEKSGVYTDQIVTDILPATDFYEAEAYHQQYFKKQRGNAD